MDEYLREEEEGEGGGLGLEDLRAHKLQFVKVGGDEYVRGCERNEGERVCVWERLGLFSFIILVCLYFLFFTQIDERKKK